MVVSVARVIVSVSDLERSLAFYEGALGFQRFWGSDDVARLRSGLVELMLHRRGAQPSDLGVAVSYLVEDVDAITTLAVSFGAEVLDAPEDQPWGERQSVIRDPDGHVVCLVAPIA